MGRRGGGAVIVLALLLQGCDVPDALPSASDTASGCVSEQVRDTPSPKEPPVALLVGPGLRHQALTGAFSWQGGGGAVDSEQPPLTERTIPSRSIAPNVPLRIMLDGEYFVAWSVTAYLAEDFFSDEQNVPEDDWGGATADTDLAFRTACLAPVRTGEWILAARLTFADGRGEGRYYWRVRVQEPALPSSGD